MKFTARQYATALLETIEKSSTEEREKIITNFLRILSRNRQFNIVNKIVIEVNNILKEKNNILEIEAITASSIEDQELQKMLEKQLNKKISLTTKIDKTIIAGLILKINDLLIDGSVKTKLKLLNNKLSNN